MTTLTYSQLEGLWINAGGDPKAAPLMAAIALAESGGRTDAVNPTDNGGTQTSWGLWQISDGTHNWGYPGQPFNPLDNAREAVAKYKGQGLRAWGTYTSGAYKSHMQGNVAPSEVLPLGNGPSVPGAFGPFSILNEAGSLFKNIPILGPFISGTQAAASDLPGALNNIGTTLAVMGTAAEGVTTFFQWLSVKGGFIRLGMGIVGIVLLFFGIHMIATAR